MPTNTKRPGSDGAREIPQPQDSDEGASSPPEAGLGNASDLVVIFGTTGDLARKMTFRALYRLERRGLLHCPIIGIAHDELTVEQLRTRAREAISGAGETLDDAVFDRLAARLSYLHGDVTQDALYDQLAAHVSRHDRPLFYLEMPPALFGPIVEHLAGAGLLGHARVAVEKPFGHDLASARALNDCLHRVLSEDQILRVDHFLGKEPVIELEYLRFANLAFAELWDRKSVSAIHITMAENFGVQDRGKFYDSVGALRDVVQNHLLQVLALVAMEPPAGASAEELRDKKVEVFKAMPAANPARYVRGQYAGYTDVPGVAPRSSTETFVALRLEIDNWRWAGVPIFLRAGKAPPERVTEVRLLLHRTPRLAFLPTPTRSGRTRSCYASTPTGGCSSRPASRIPGGRCTWKRPSPRSWASRWNPTNGCCAPPWSATRNCSPGRTPSSRPGASCNRCWDSPPTVHPYPGGSWGPDEADSLLHGHPRWQQPWLAE